MSDPIKPTDQDAPKPAGDGLRLGRRDWIKAMEGHPKADPKKNNLIYAFVYDGFVKSDGEKHYVRRWLGTHDMDEAEVKLEQQVIPKLERAWDEAERNGCEFGIPLSDTVTPAADPAKPRCVAERLGRLIELHESNPDRNGTTPNAKSMAKMFIRDSGDLALGDDRDYTEEDCKAIRSKMMNRWDSSTDTPRQNMWNLRFVLREVGFPEKLTDIFWAPKVKNKKKRKKELIFFPQECIAMFGHLGEATWEQEGMTVLSANGTMNFVDLVLSRRDDFEEAMNSFAENERSKNGNAFGYIFWDRTIDWYHRREKPNAFYLLWRYLLTDEEAADPEILCKALPKEEEQRRKRDATRKARQDFDKYLRVTCKIKRSLATQRCFRNTTIAGFEAAAVPRYIGMDDTGHTCEANYLRYPRSTIPQMRELAAIKEEIYLNPDKPQIFTHTRAVEATNKNILNSEGRIVVEVQSVLEQLAKAREENHALRGEMAELRAGLCGVQQMVSTIHVLLTEQNSSNAQPCIPFIRSVQWATTSGDLGNVLHPSVAEHVANGDGPNPVPT